ncbi:hypothetical protein ACFL9T_08270 [Thermodesulfobacteriota bacterium]
MATFLQKMDDQLNAHPYQNVAQRFIFIVAETDKCPVPENYLSAIGGKPILSYSMEAAIKCINDKSKMAVVTDSPDVSEFVERSGIQLVFLSTERIGKYDWLSDAINYTSDFHKDRLFHIGLISPCYPFITAIDLKKAFRLCEEQKDGIVGSGTQSDKSIWHHHFLQDGLFPKRLFLGDDVIRYGGFRQDDQPLYIINDAIRIFASHSGNDPGKTFEGIAFHRANILYNLNSFSRISVSTVQDLIIANAVLSGGLAGRDNYI